MSNVIHVTFPTREARRAATLDTLLRDFASARRARTDVFWLKENGELLNILECTHTEVPASLLSPYEDTYRESVQRLAFFPQYYRFQLSMALDLEDLGQPGDLGAQLCDWVVDQDLVGGETSDIQRLEAKRLLARRGRASAMCDAGLEDRLRAFIAHPARFALPNKKAAYELTHIVFYLSEYGRRDPKLDASTCESLENVGMWAFLDGNSDLLAEICIAMRYAGCNPNEMWENWIAQQMKSVTIMRAAALPPQDAYHAVFMGAWLARLRGEPGLEALALPSGEGVPVLDMARPRTSALREMSQHLFGMSDRSGDWQIMRDRLGHRLSEAARESVDRAEASGDAFMRFFEGFARATPGASAAMSLRA